MVMTLASGCHWGDPGEAPVRLNPSPKFYVADIPLPEGFRIVDPLGESRATGTRRLYLRHVYEGQGDHYSVRDFYEREMPLFGWAKVSDGNVGGLITIRFEKASESCTAEIRESGFGKTRVQILIGQEERAPAPPTTRKNG